MDSNIYARYVKRILDFSMALALAVVLSPVLLCIALLVRVKLGSPVLFLQERPGLHGKIFRLYKFRTMTDARDANGALLPDSVRLTGFGKLLRSTSLDEIPELWNVLKGDMSLVGPRPLLVRYLPLYTERQRHRHDVRPGITGLAQVRGRNGISWQERFEWDIRYVESVSFLTDCKILWDTAGVVLKREGIHSETSVTMEEFKGE